MHYTLGNYSPCNKFTRMCRNKNVIQIDQTITETKPTKTNVLLRIYQYLCDINKRIHKNKTDNIKPKTTLNKTT